MRIRVTMRDKGSKDFYHVEKQRIEEMTERTLERIAKRCESVIRYMIENKTAGGTGKLANAVGWDAEPIVGGWGVGDIMKLNTEVSYWAHQNWGSEGIGANWDHYLPKGFWVNGRWVKSDNGFAGIKPKTPIEALNYIESTLSQMEIEIPNILKRK